MMKWSELTEIMSEEEAYTYIVETELLQEHAAGLDKSQFDGPCNCPYCPAVRQSKERKVTDA